MNSKAFWAFSLEFYGRQGVAPACVALQDIYGADVNVVLFTLWCASRGRRLATPELNAIHAAVAFWRLQVVQPIRQARRSLKAAPSPPFCATATEALRERLLAVELETERLQQGAMETLAPPPGLDNPTQVAMDNLACFAWHAGIPPDNALFTALLRVFP
jgi:uncharacterized protein (TIGR02444 family)